jgi:hypothetical protein
MDSDKIIIPIEEEEIEAFVLGAFDEDSISLDKGIAYSPYEDNDDYN